MAKALSEETRMRKVPESEVITPVCRPRIVTETPGRGFSFSSSSFPETIAPAFFWEKAGSASNIEDRARAANTILKDVLFTMTDKKRSIYVFEYMNGLFWVTGMEDGAACHEDVGASFDEAGGVFDGDASIDLDKRVEAPVMYHAAQVTDLLVGMGDEFLTAEARIDAHDQYGVYVLQDIA